MRSPPKVRLLHSEEKLRFLNDVRGAPGGPGFIMFLNERQKGCPPVQEAVQGNSDIVGSMMQRGAVGRYFTPANYRTLDGHSNAHQLCRRRSNINPVGKLNEY